MLFYCKITESEEIDKLEVVDVVRDGGVFSSIECDICHLYFFKNKNTRLLETSDLNEKNGDF